MRPMTFYLGGLTSWFGAIGIQTVMFPFLITMQLGEGPTELGIAMMALFLPTFLLILVGGATADHLDSRRILIFVHFVAGVPPLALFVVISMGFLSYPVLLVYAVAMGIAGAFIIPARDALLSHIATGKIQKAVMAATAVQFGSQIVGFGLASLEGVIGVALVFLSQTVLLWMGAALAFKLPTHKPEGSKAPSLAVIGEGLREVSRSPRLLAPTAIVFGVGILFFGTSQVVMPMLIRDIFLGGSRELAMSNVAMMSGIIATVIVIARRGGIVRQGRALILALGTGAFVMASFAIAPTFPAFMGVAFLWGCGGGVAMTMNRTIIQESAPASHRGRILSVFQMGVLGGAPIGAFLCGLYIEWWGPQLAVVLPSIGMLVMLALACALTPIWSIRALSDDATSD